MYFPHACAKWTASEERTSSRSFLDQYDLWFRPGIKIPHLALAASHRGNFVRHKDQYLVGPSPQGKYARIREPDVTVIGPAQ